MKQFWMGLTAGLGLAGGVAVVEGQAESNFFEDGNSVYNNLIGSEDWMNAAALGYVMGAADTHMLWQLYLERMEERAVCFPPNANRLQAADVVKKHMENDPATRHLVAASIVTHALHLAFPCASD